MNSALQRAVLVMGKFKAPWGIAGGWALDLFLGHESRPHADVDIAILRADHSLLRSQLSGRFHKVVDGQLAEWPAGEVLPLSVHEIYLTRPDGHGLEFLLNEHDPERQEWVFRRDGRIRRPLAEAFVVGPVPYLAPEIVLLYKAKAPAAKDDADFHAVLPHLQHTQRSWLRQALDMTASGHPWARLISQEA